MARLPSKILTIYAFLLTSQAVAAHDHPTSIFKTYEAPLHNCGPEYQLFPNEYRVRFLQGYTFPEHIDTINLGRELKAGVWEDYLDPTICLTPKCRRTFAEPTLKRLPESEQIKVSIGWNATSIETHPMTVSQTARKSIKNGHMLIDEKYFRTVDGMISLKSA